MHACKRSQGDSSGGAYVLPDFRLLSVATLVFRFR